VADHSGVRKLSILILPVLAACLLAGSSEAGNPLAGLPSGWSHATINVLIKRQPHTLIYDRGQVVAFTAGSLTLRERDGSVVVINVAPNAKVVIAGRPASLSQVRRLEIATTMSIDGAPATTVRVQIPAAVAKAIRREAIAGSAIRKRGGSG
jgi:hypothetical protein